MTWNLEPEKKPMKQFIEDYNLFNLIKKPTCFKSLKGTCIDLILTNKKFSFKFSDTYETGLSDCHTLVHTMFKSSFYKLQPQKIFYRNYKMFNNQAYLTEVSNTLFKSKQENVLNYESLELCLMSILNKHAPLKQKTIRGNDKPFISKTIHKAIFQRSKLKNKYNKTGQQSDWISFKKQRNFVCALIKKEKKVFFSNVAIKPCEKKFWKACKPYLNNKVDFSNERISLLENGELVSEESRVAQIFNSHFANILSTLNITQWNKIPPSVNDHTLIYPEYSNHPSIIKIKQSLKDSDFFYFKHVEPKTVFDVINKLKKGSGGMPIHILKLLKDTCSGYLTDCINTSIDKCVFPNTLKWAEVIPVFKNKGEAENKENYRPISILPTISKVFERIIFDQINNFMQNKFSKLLCGFRKGFSTQIALTKLLQKWQQSLDKKEIIGTVLIDLSKAYDCIQHDLLLAKLEAYCFSEKALKFLKSYLKGRKQKVKIGSAFSKWLEINFGIPQGSILGPLLFNIFINDIFLFMNETDLCNFADDNTLYVSDTTVDKVIEKLKTDILNINKWFSNNSLVANPSKYQLMFLGLRQSEENLSIKIGNSTIMATDEVELLGVIIDNKLSFSNHIKRLCKYANNKLYAIIRMRQYLSTSQTKLLINSYVLSYFSYCPLLWMFCYKKEMSLINRIHKRALRTIYNNFTLELDELLLIDSSCSIHTKHLRTLMTEIYKTLRKENPELMWNIFETKCIPYNLRNKMLINLPKAESTTFGTNSLVFKGSLIWNTLPNNIKNSPTQSIFRKKIKTWNGENCTCRLCK